MAVSSRVKWHPLCSIGGGTAPGRRGRKNSEGRVLWVDTRGSVTPMREPIGSNTPHSLGHVSRPVDALPPDCRIHFSDVGSVDRCAVAPRFLHLCAEED
ncbi:hypothetical protein EVAR_37490_1 [Eumeta japonica]|uniref:Uncharacterized protein n=1 Tax=Eumeta variegata TaxID=151549 RepID=A0A4C1XDF4_EUMVA|nr:hypothetical protein EVAR_37490_1 [Eumeta japonica]